MVWRGTQQGLSLSDLRLQMEWIVSMSPAGRSRADVREITVKNAFNLVHLNVLSGENLV